MFVALAWHNRIFKVKKGGLNEVCITAESKQKEICGFLPSHKPHLFVNPLTLGENRLLCNDVNTKAVTAVHYFSSGES